MTEFDLEKLNEGTWFTYCDSRVDDKTGEVIFDDPKDDAGRVCIRQASFELLEQIENEAGGKLKHEFVLNPNSKRMEPVELRIQTIEEKRKNREMLWDYVIEDWEGFRDKSYNDIPATLENKLKLINLPVFTRFINRCLEILNGQKEVSEKN